jgi:chromosome segregation ATPase
MQSRKYGDQDLKNSLQLTAQLERSLRKLLTSKKNLKQTLDVCEVDDQDFIVVTESKDRELERMRERTQAERKELLADNEMLSREVMTCKEEVRELKKEVANYKKYVKFLQDYNADLKREMVFWMSKPSKLDIAPPQLPPNNLMTEVLKLRSQNEAR